MKKDRKPEQYEQEDYRFAFILWESKGLIICKRLYTQKAEPLLWSLAGIAAPLILSKSIGNKVFLHALCIGLFWGVLNGLIPSAFFDQYLTNSPNWQDRFKQSTFIPPGYFLLISGLVVGLITGIALGGLTLLFKKIG